MMGTAALERELDPTRRERGVVEVRRTLWRTSDPRRGVRFLVVVTVRTSSGLFGETAAYPANPDGTMAHPRPVARWSNEIDHHQAIRRAGWSIEYADAPAR